MLRAWEDGECFGEVFGGGRTGWLQVEVVSTRLNMRVEEVTRLQRVLGSFSSPFKTAHYNIMFWSVLFDFVNVLRKQFKGFHTSHISEK